MEPWMALAIFLLGAGVGSLVSAALHAKEIRKLKELLKTAHSNSRTEQRPLSQAGRARVSLTKEKESVERV